MPPTFAIWGPIFALSGAYAVRQARPAAREHALLRRVGWLTASAFTGDALWEIVVPRRHLELGQALVVGTAASATVASAVSTGDTLARHGLDGEAEGSRAGVALLAGAGALAGHLARRGGGAAPPHAAGYGAAVLWGLGGVAINREAGWMGRAGALVAGLPVVLGLAMGTRPA